MTTTTGSSTRTADRSRARRTTRGARTAREAQHTHTCVYFDDGAPELLCSCGCRAVLLVDEDGHDVALYALLEDESVTPGRRGLSAEAC